MSNSPLVSYTKISPNKTPRAYRNSSSTGKISKITIHHMAGCISVESCGSWFAQSSAKCSSNYGIDSTGKIALYVPEGYRSWCSSNGDNDNIAITIEIANSKSGNPWPVSDKALAACIDLCVDICQRNGIEQLVYTGTTSGNLTRHDMFCNKVCPGPYLGGKFPYIVEQVNAKLGKPLEITASSVKPNLQYGDDNSYVSKCQELLMKLGYSIGVKAPTGYFGSNTLAAVKLFQSANKLEIDGIVGPKTWATLFSDKAVKYVAPAATTTSSKSDEETIWDFLYAKLGNAYGAAGMMGNLQAESALRSTNLQNTYEKSLGYTDAEYTAAVDSGKYTKFASDSAGYGLAQWTYGTRKANLLAYAKSEGKSIGDLGMQLNFLWKELSESYTGVLTSLKTAKSVKAASDVVLTQFERPLNQGDSVKATRAGYGQTFYDKYAKASSSPAPSTSTSTKVDSGTKASTVVNIALGEVGYKEKASNSYLDLTTANAGSNNWTKYARDLYNAGYYNGNKNGYAWCDVFVDWCFYKAFGKTEGQLMEYQTGELGAACPYSAGYYKARGRYDRNPKYGDQVFFQQNGALVHTGLVVEVGSSTVTVVEGNKSNMVQKVTYSKSNSYIAGYGHPNYDTVDAPSTSGSSSSSTSSSGNSNIKSFQTWLNSNFGTGLSVDGVYGPLTKKAAIKAFQSSMNSIYGKSLSVDGIFGSKSKASLSNVALKYGATGNLVRVLQGMLYCLGYNPNGFDGIFGNGTKSAVTSFQKAKGLTQDGIAGQATFAALFA